MTIISASYWLLEPLCQAISALTEYCCRRIEGGSAHTTPSAFLHLIRMVLLGVLFHLLFGGEDHATKFALKLLGHNISL
jgi:hypothetical protein